MSATKRKALLAINGRFGETIANMCLVKR